MKIIINTVPLHCSLRIKYFFKPIKNEDFLLFTYSCPILWCYSVIFVTFTVQKRFGNFKFSKPKPQFINYKISYTFKGLI